MSEFSDYGEEEFVEEEKAEPRNIREPELRLFFVCYGNGNFHSSTNDQDIAWSTARRIDGMFGELVNVQRPRYLEEVAPPALVRQITDALENPEKRTQRERPKAA